MARPRADDFAEKRRRVLAAATALFARNGYSSTSMSDIADACGIAKSVVYHYYDSKPRLLSDIMRSHALELLEEAMTAVEGIRAPEERFRALTRALLEAYVARPLEQAVLNRERAHLTGKPRKDADRAQKQLVDLAARVLAEIQPAALADAHEARVAALVFFGAVNWTHTWFDPKGPMRAADLAERIADLHLVGLKGLKPR
jgi:AcrR family transcriptional regulator